MSPGFSSLGDDRVDTASLEGESFFQKDVSRHPPPPWVQTAEVRSSSGETTTYVLCQDQPSLLYVANLGCIELNPWHARVGSLDRPDYLVLDLDPEAVSFDRVVEAALVVRKLLERAGAECLCKTSGKRGLHVVVPLGARYSEDQARQFAQLIATRQLAPQTRARRRADRAEALAAYRATSDLSGKAGAPLRSL